MDWSTCSQTVTNPATGQVVGSAATLNCVPVLLKLLINAAFAFVGVTALFFIVMSGIKFITASGNDPKQVETARKTLTFAIVGLIIVLMSFFIVNFVAFVSGTPCIAQFDNFSLGSCQ